MTTALRPATKKRIRRESNQSTEIRAVDATELTPGTCGRVSFVGLRYNQPDTYGTIFKPGCLTKTVGQKVASGNVKYYADHTYTTHEHIGVVRSVTDVGNDVLVGADIFDTASGRAYLEYAKACLAAKAQTGASIGFYDRASDIEEIDGQRVWAYSEVELEEFSATPANAVDGADLLSARHDPGDRPALLRKALDGILAALPEDESRAAFAARFVSDSSTSTTTGNAAATTDSAAPRARNADGTDSTERTATGTPSAPAIATMADRLAAIRKSFALT